MSLAVVTGETTFEVCLAPPKSPTTVVEPAAIEVADKVVSEHKSISIADGKVVPQEDKPTKRVRPRKRIEDNVMRYRRRYKSAFRQEYVRRRFTKTQSFEREMLFDAAWEGSGYLHLDYRFLAAEAFVDTNDLVEFARFKKQVRRVLLYDFEEVKEPDGTRVMYSQTMANDRAAADKFYERQQVLGSRGGVQTQINRKETQ
jgi:hypothetical protein